MLSRNDYFKSKSKLHLKRAFTSSPHTLFRIYHVRKHWNVACFNLDHGSFAPSNCVGKPDIGKGHAGLDCSLNTHRGLPCLKGIWKAHLPGGLPAGVSPGSPTTGFICRLPLPRGNAAGLERNNHCSAVRPHQEEFMG